MYKVEYLPNSPGKSYPHFFGMVGKTKAKPNKEEPSEVAVYFPLLKAPEGKPSIYLPSQELFLLDEKPIDESENSFYHLSKRVEELNKFLSSAQKSFEYMWRTSNAPLSELSPAIFKDFRLYKTGKFIPLLSKSNSVVIEVNIRPCQLPNKENLGRRIIGNERSIIIVMSDTSEGLFQMDGVNLPRERLSKDTFANILKSTKFLIKPKEIMKKRLAIIEEIRAGLASEDQFVNFVIAPGKIKDSRAIGKDEKNSFDQLLTLSVKEKQERV